MFPGSGVTIILVVLGDNCTSIGSDITGPCTAACADNSWRLVDTSFAGGGAMLDLARGPYLHVSGMDAVMSLPAVCYFNCPVIHLPVAMCGVDLGSSAVMGGMVGEVGVVLPS